MIITLLAVLFTLCTEASPLDNATTAEKGFFGENFVEEFMSATGRKCISIPKDPCTIGPDRIFLLPDGTIELHEIKAYSTWAGENALKTTANGQPTYQLSKRWVTNWISSTLHDSSSSQAQRALATKVKEAIANGKCKYVLDSINLSEGKIITYQVLQKGTNDISITTKTGPVKISHLRSRIRRSKQTLEIIRNRTPQRLMKSPKIHSTTNLKPGKMKAICRKETGFKGRIEVRPALLTPTGRLLVSMKAGSMAGLMVFAADTGMATFYYFNGEINQRELGTAIEYAAIRALFVGVCVGVTVALGATPGGICVLAVAIGAYFIVDTAIRMWEAHLDKQYLTINDLRSFGITSDTTLDLVDTPLEMEYDTPLNLAGEDCILDILK